MPAKARRVAVHREQLQPGGERSRRRLTRRRFIRHAISGAGMVSSASFLCSCAAAKHDARPAWHCRLSTSSILFKGLPLEAACARIAALGFEAVDIWSAYDNCPHLDDAVKRLGPSGLKALLARVAGVDQFDALQTVLSDLQGRARHVFEQVLAD